ncbi:MAG: helix-hairpin-helix domain-containing protein [Vulcanimicrobiaceae bacterium]
MLRYGAIVAAAVVAVLAIWHPAPHPPMVAAAAAEPHRGPIRHASTKVAATVALVYVVGAVAKPGLYRVPSGGRADDAVRAAGGLLPGADPVGVNLAAHVADGDEIDVPGIGTSPMRTPKASRSKRVAARGPRKRAPLEAVDLNSGDAAALSAIPGIGATIAARIVALREREGPYDSFDELLDVAGMSPARLAHAQPYLILR